MDAYFNNWLHSRSLNGMLHVVNALGYICLCCIMCFSCIIDLHYIAYNFIFVCFYDCSHVYSIFSFLISCLIVHALIFLVLYII